MYGPDRIYTFYEHAVQSPVLYADFFARLFHELRGRRARVLKEDFCGTFAIAAAWVARDRENRAIAVDLDAEALSVGGRRHLARLGAQARRRLAVHHGDVRDPLALKADLVVACNQSVLMFHTEPELLRYFRAARRALTDEGLLVLEVGRWEGPARPGKHSRLFQRGGRPWFRYDAEKRFVDRRTRTMRFTIGFEDARGMRYPAAFSYDFRYWSIARLERLLRGAGFASTGVAPSRARSGAGLRTVQLVAAV